MAVSSKTIDSFIQSFNRENTGLNSKSKTTADQNTKDSSFAKKTTKKNGHDSQNFYEDI